MLLCIFPNSLNNASALQRLYPGLLLANRRFDLWMHILSQRQVYKWLGLCIMHRLPCRSLQRQTGAEQLFNRVPTLPCGALRRQAWSLLSTVLRPLSQGIVQQARCDRVHNLPGGEVQRRGWLRSPRLQDLCLQILRQLRGPSRQHVLS